MADLVTARALRRMTEVSAVTATSSPTEIPATDEIVSATPQPPEAVVTATSVREATRIAPASIRLTAIRETVNAMADLSTARALRRMTEVSAVTATSSPTEIPATDEIASATPQPTEAMATATPVDEATRIARANLTLTAIRETVSALQAPSTERALPTEDRFATAATDTLPATVTKLAPATVSTTAAARDVTVTATQGAVFTQPTVGKTATARLATATATATISATRTPTGLPSTKEIDPQMPTETPSTTDTATVLPATTAYATASATLSWSPTPSPTLTITPTETPLPFYFAYLIPTPTAYGSIEDAFRIDCEVEQGWLSYEVQEGDSLLAMALATDSSLIELRDGNCFEPIRGIFAGEKLLVPQLPESPVERPVPTFFTDEEVSPVVGCDHSSVKIFAPQPLAQVEAIFALIGNALIPEGGSYHIALKPGWSDVYYPYLESDQTVRNDVIGLINAEIFGAGSHRIRLMITDSKGDIIEGGICDIPVVFGTR